MRKVVLFVAIAFAAAAVAGAAGTGSALAYGPDIAYVLVEDWIGGLAAVDRDRALAGGEKKTVAAELAPKRRSVAD